MPFLNLILTTRVKLSGPTCLLRILPSINLQGGTLLSLIIHMSLILGYCNFEFHLYR